MSFSVGMSVRSLAEVKDKFLETVDRHQAGMLPNRAFSDEALKSLGAAQIAAQILLASLGDEWVKADVRVSGHANPDNVQLVGWSNDRLTVEVAIDRYAQHIDIGWDEGFDAGFAEGARQERLRVQEALAVSEDDE